MKHVACICGNNDCNTIKSFNGSSKLIKCKSCKLVFVHPQPSREEIQKMYSENFLNNFEYYLYTSKDDEKTFNKRLELAEHFCKRGIVLDIGSSTGTFLKVAKDRGWNCFGVELNKKAAELCRKKQKLKVYNKIPSNGSFNLINMSDVIEHFTNPKKELLRVRKLLKRRGILMISTPDYDKFITKVFQIKRREHLFYFTKDTLRTLLLACGFSIVQIFNTSRFQSVKSLLHSSTFRGPKKMILKLLLLSGLYKLIEYAIIKNSKDDILVIAQKN